MTNLHLPALIAVPILATVMAGSVMAQDAVPAEPGKATALRTVMVKLGREMQDVTAAISKEDWARVAELAPMIANHAEPPPAEKIRILSWLGSDAAKFRGFDRQVHDAANTMMNAAKRRDGEAVVLSFSKVQQHCLGCHQAFRQPFIAHFYESR